MNLQLKEMSFLAEIATAIKANEHFSITEDKKENESQIKYTFIANKMLDFYQPLTDFNTEDIWIYDDEKGNWINNGEMVIKKAIRTVNKIYSKNGINEILDKIKVDTYFIEFPFNLKNIVVLRNKTLNLDAYIKGEEFVFDHNREFMSTIKLSYDYDPNAECPNIQQFFDAVCLDDDKMKVTLHEFASDCLTNHYKSQRMLWNYGEGNNGKGVYGRLLAKLIGKENTTSLGINSLQDDSKITHQLRFSKLNVIGDYSNKFVYDSGFIKKMTGEDQITAEIKYAKNAIKFTNNAKMLISGQYVLNSSEDNEGWYRRILLLEWKYKVKESDEKPNFEEILSSEISGWFNIVLWFYKTFNLQNFKYTYDTKDLKKKKFEIEIRKNPTKVMLDFYVDYKSDKHISCNRFIDAIGILCEIFNVPKLATSKIGREITKNRDTISRGKVNNLDNSQTKVYKGIQFNKDFAKLLRANNKEKFI